MPQLSIIIPIYNASLYIRECAKSLLTQTYKKLELIFVDDCSTDGSVALVEDLVAQYPNCKHLVKIIKMCENGGPMNARWRGVRESTGELIMFCDADDWMTEEACEKMVSSLVENNGDVVVCSMARVSKGVTQERICPNECSLTGAEAVSRLDEIPGLTSFVAKIYHRELVLDSHIEVPRDLRIAEDLCFNLQAIARCRRLISIKDVLYFYRQNNLSVVHSAKIADVVRAHRRAYEIIARTLPENISVSARNYLSKMILYWGIVGGDISRREIAVWRNNLEAAGGKWEWSDRSLWGQRLMKIANKSWFLASLLAPFVRSRITDQL